MLCVVSRFAPRSVPSRSSSPLPHLRFTGTIILNHQVRYKSSVRVVRVVVVLFFASTRTLRSSPYKPSYTHFEQGRDDLRPRPLRHVSHGSGSSVSTLCRRSFPVLTKYTLPLTTTNASFAPAARRCPHPAHTRYTPHHPSVRPTPLPTRAHYPP